MREPIKVRLAVALGSNGHVIAVGMEPARMKDHPDAEAMLTEFELLNDPEFHGTPTFFFQDVEILPGPAGTRRSP